MGILKTSVAAIAAISCTQPGCPPLETKTDVAAANNRAPVATVIPPAAGGNAGEPDALDDEDAGESSNIPTRDQQGVVL